VSPDRARLYLTPRQQVIQGLHDSIALRCERADRLGQLGQRHRNDLQGMQNHGRLADFEERIETRVNYLADRRRLYERHDDPAAIVVEKGGLDDNDVGNAITMLTAIPMNVARK
jgi:hypothetical protein